MQTLDNAISLLKEIRIISGINYRKLKEDSKYDISHIQYKNQFSYINTLIDKFKDEFKLEGFKKWVI